MAATRAEGSRGFTFGGPFGDFNGPYNGVGVQSSFAAYDIYNTPQPGPGPTKPAAPPPVIVGVPMGTCSGLQSFWTGATMGGMLVTMAFNDASMETAVWMGAFFGQGSVMGTGWSITETGDTSIASWTVTNNTGKGIVEMHFQGCPGNTVFDRTLPSPGTPGSSTGVDYVQTGGTFASISQATYLGPAGVGSTPPVGDIFTDMLVDFPELPLASGQTLLFRADTDGCLTCGSGPVLTAAHTCPSFTDMSSGGNLVGASVTATFADTTTETVTWSSLGGGAGNAVGTGWSVAQSGDTFSNPFTVTNNRAGGVAMADLVIDLNPSSNVWNTMLGTGKTAGSGTGLTFVITGGSFAGSVVYEYTGLVGLGAAAPLGDLYTQLEIAFTNVLPSGQTLQFKADTDICGSVGAFGSVQPAQMVWHIESEFKIWQDSLGTIPAADSLGILRWDDLVGGVHNLKLEVLPPGNNKDYCSLYQATGTGTHRPDLQVSYAAGYILFSGQGYLDSGASAFNFFTAGGKWSYAVFLRGIAGKANYSVLDDGNGTSNGICIGYGNPDLSTNQDPGHGGSGADSTYRVMFDGTGTQVDSGIVSSLNGLLVVTYDGTAAGATIIYFAQTNNSPPYYTLTTGPTVNHVGITASGGFAMAGTVGNVVPARMNTTTNVNPNSISLCEAAVWSGILSSTDINNLAARCRDYWGFT
jgi:hypothetical protein